MIIEEGIEMVGSRNAAQIEIDEARKHSKHTFYGPMSRKRTACQCLVCGQKFGEMMQAHAVKHGYESREAMDKAGLIQWLQR